jgi:PAS domain S-box-containing protein
MHIERLLSAEKRALEQEVKTRCESEQALRENSERMRDFTELSSDWYWEQDSEFRFTLVSQRFASELKVPLQDYIGLRRWDKQPEDIDPELWQAHRRQVEAHQPFRDLIYAMRDRVGRKHFLCVSGKPVFDAEGSFRGYRGTGRDITAAKQVEAALHAEKERAEVTLASIADAVITTDPDGIITYLNPVAEGLTGWTLAQAQGQPLARIYRRVEELTRVALPDPVQEATHDALTGLLNRREFDRAGGLSAGAGAAGGRMQRIQPLKRPSVGAHFEVLVRMLDVDGGLVPPGMFLPAAERYQLMPAIDRWVVRNTFAACQRALARNPAAIECCAINLSGASLSDAGLLDFVRAQFALYQVPYRLICFEITETAAISNITLAMGFIREMKALGCRFALDDFGSGMSSFGYLKHLPVDYLKIDGSFVKDMLNNPSDLAAVESIHRIGQVFGIETVAEFVENEAIRARLVEAGVDFAQGYGIAKPMPLALDVEPLENLPA